MAILECAGVSKRFGGLHALSDVDLTVEAGTITALIGPNGAGKTTLFNAFTGFASIDAGTIRFEGRRIDALAAWRIARMGLARTFQTPAGFASLTARENLIVAGANHRAEGMGAALLGPAAWRRDEAASAGRADELLEEIGLAAIANIRVRDLSAADAKLVEILRQLITRPRLLMLDEPASGFGPALLGRLADFIRLLKARGVTVLLIEHNLAFVAALADYAHVLAGGAVIARGRPAEVMRDEEVVRRYLGMSHEPSGHH